MIDLLFQLGADPNVKNKYGESCSKLLEDRKKSHHLVWLDTELTSLEDPEILECAIIITDKDLKEIDKAHWIIHYDEKFLNGLSKWHQENFASKEKKGNGLFDDCIGSKLTKEEFETDCLKFLEKHIPKAYCSLAGSSIHCDKEVLRLKHLKLYQYFNHRIVDVSTLYGLMERWMPKKLLHSPVITHDTNHRAMDDINRSIKLLAWFRENMLQPDSQS